MSSYPINPQTGRRDPPVGEGVGQTLFEIAAVLVLGFVGITLVAALLYGCMMLWALILA